MHDEFQSDDPASTVSGFIAGVSIFDLNRVSEQRLKICDVEPPSVIPLTVEGKSVGRNESHDFPSQGIIESASAVI